MPHRPLERCLLVAALCLGCGAATRDITREATRTAVHTTLDSLDDDDNQRMVLRLLGSPAALAAARALAADVLDASLDTLSLRARSQRIVAMSARYLQALLASVFGDSSGGRGRTLSPALASAVRQSIDVALREALSARQRAALQRAAEALAHAAAEAASRGLADGLSRDLAPALESALTDPRTTRALAATSRSVAREMVLGGSDALAQMQRAQQRTGRPSVLTNLSEVMQSGAHAAQWLMLGAVLLCVALALWAVRLGRRGRPAPAPRVRRARGRRVRAQARRALAPPAV